MTIAFWAAFHSGTRSRGVVRLGRLELGWLVKDRERILGERFQAVGRCPRMSPNSAWVERGASRGHNILVESNEPERRSRFTPSSPSWRTHPPEQPYSDFVHTQTSRLHSR
jgi:hypothetical protein